MSFSRFSEADVYVFEHVGGFIQCCGCSLSESELGLDNTFGMYDAKTPREMLDHLAEHEKLGHDVWLAKSRIGVTYKDLDAPIEPYIQSEEEKARAKEIMGKYFPPKEFRDIANGE